MGCPIGHPFSVGHSWHQEHNAKTLYHGKVSGLYLGRASDINNLGIRYENTSYQVQTANNLNGLAKTTFDNGTHSADRLEILVGGKGCHISLQPSVGNKLPVRSGHQVALGGNNLASLFRFEHRTQQTQSQSRTDTA